jgi:N-acetylglucosaminyl-diphospho-decaprenol L-rhamnosyltransferase
VSTAPKVAVVIVNFNAGEHLRACVESVTADLAAISRAVYVVDNASVDGSVAAVEHDPEVTLVRNTRNRGFGAAVNQAVQLTAADLVWLLNPDCRVATGTFARLEEVLRRHDACAIAAARLLNADGSVQASARGEPSAWTGLFGRHGLLTKFFPRSALARRNLPAADLARSDIESAVVDWVMGACMLIRRDRFVEVNGFDEGYFLYWEDADLCRRLRARGYETRYVPAAAVTHVGAVSAGTQSALATREFHRSAYRYYATHVVPTPWHPARGFARLALALRAWWRTRTL